MSKFYYNGVLLPEIPSDVLAEYPYCWIRNNTTSGNYDLIFGKQSWYFSDNTMNCQNSNDEKWYTLPISTSAEATGWNFSQNTTGEFGIDSNRTVLWSNHDIPNGSATATGVYFSATEPIGENEVKAKSLKYETYTNFYLSSGNINYEVDSLTINYIIPVTKYSTYTVTMTEIGNRLRCVFTTTDPSTIVANVTGCTDVVMNPTYDVGYEFSYMASEDGWLVVYVSNAGETPAISIVTNGVGGDGSPLYALLYLIRSEGIIYTIVDNMMKSLAETELTSEVFQTYGVDEVPEWSAISELTNPEILYWHDSLDDLPTITTTMTATPPPQILLAEPFYMIDSTIKGIESVTVESAGNPLISLSFSGGDFEHYDGTNGWVVSTESEGMLPDVLTAIDLETWSAKVAGVQSIQIRVILSSTDDSLTSIKFNFINE